MKKREIEVNVGEIWVQQATHDRITVKEILGGRVLYQYLNGQEGRMPLSVFPGYFKKD